MTTKMSLFCLILLKKLLNLNNSSRTMSAVCIVQVRLKESETALLEISTICSLIIRDHQRATCRSVLRAAPHSPHSLSSSGW